MQRQALSRSLRPRKPPRRAESERARMVVFSSSKPGSGASTLACQTAFALRKSGKRILLADFDLLNGSVAFFAKITPEYSLADALEQMVEAGQSDLTSLVVNADGIDVLPAPGSAAPVRIDPDRLHDLLEAA